MEQLDTKAVWLFFVRFLLIGSFVLIGLIFTSLPLIIGGSISENIPIMWRFSILVAFLCFCFFYVISCYLWAQLTRRCWRYQITEDTLKIEKGVIWKKYIFIPYERIQNIDIDRGIVDRVMGLSSLHIQTAGAEYGYGRQNWKTGGYLPGLTQKKAEELREYFFQNIRGTKQGF